MKKMKRIISAALTLALAAGMLAGCAGSSSGTPAASSAGGASAGSSSAERERITVRVFRSKASHEVAMDQMDVFKVMGEMFNIDFEFDNPPQENYTERLNLVMMETELPDVIMEIPVTDVLKYGETGVILPLNDYIENSMPNLKAEMDKRDGVEKALTYSDGNIYYLPMLDETPSGNIPYIVRTDWLDQLGLERPVTIEDWENYWSLVKTTDLNGNGKNDEIPFSAYEIERLRNFCTAWGVLDDFYTDPTDGGKVHYGPIEDKYKEALVWMNDMWNKGYIDQEIITNRLLGLQREAGAEHRRLLRGPARRHAGRPERHDGGIRARLPRRRHRAAERRGRRTDSHQHRPCPPRRCGRHHHLHLQKCRPRCGMAGLYVQRRGPDAAEHGH